MSTAHDTTAKGVPPRRLDAVLFDMDGVITDTAAAHAAAWKRLFDEFLQGRAEDARPFGDDDYLAHVDGRPRYAGVESFLRSRGIELPFGTEADAPDEDTICGLGNRKNRYFNAWLDANPVEAFPGSLALVDSLRQAGVRTAVFSSSRNAAAVLRSAGVIDLFDAGVDGSDMAALGLPGKPDPAIMMQAARLLDVASDRTAIVEDALAGVEAGAAGDFAQVIGVDREGTGEALRGAGADLVVADLAELVLDPGRGLVARTLATARPVWDATEELAARLAGRRPAVFLDYDGTLSPIVADPKAAVLGEGMRAALARLAERVPVAIVSGRDLDDVRGLVPDDRLYFVGSHGFDLAGPGGWREVVEQGKAFLPALEAAAGDLEAALEAIEGARLERKRFALAVHYRQVAEAEAGALATAVADAMRRHGSLRASPGKKVYDIKPRTDWHKGRAVLSLLRKLALDTPEVLPLYLGDDTTDEDAFRALSGRGIGIVVRDGADRRTAARYSLDGTDAVERFLGWLAREVRR